MPRMDPPEKRRFTRSLGFGVRAAVGARVPARVQRSVFPGVFGSVGLRILGRIVPSGVGPRVIHVVVKSEAGIAIAFIVVVVLMLVVLLALHPVAHLLGTPHLDVALEGLQLHARAARADLERFAMLARGA